MSKTAKSKKEETPAVAEVAVETTESPVAIITPTEEEIGRRAYEIYLERGADDGYSLDDWLQAERELMGIKSEDQGISV